MRQNPFMLIKNFTPKQVQRGKRRELRGKGSDARGQRSGQAFTTVPMRKRKINLSELGKQEEPAKESFDLFEGKRATIKTKIPHVESDRASSCCDRHEERVADSSLVSRE